MYCTPNELVEQLRQKFWHDKFPTVKFDVIISDTEILVAFGCDRITAYVPPLDVKWMAMDSAVPELIFVEMPPFVERLAFERDPLYVIGGVIETINVNMVLQQVYAVLDKIYRNDRG